MSFAYQPTIQYGYYLTPFYCYECAGPHREHAPVLSAEAKPFAPSKVRCYECGGPHLNQDCPLLPDACRMAIAKGSEIKISCYHCQGHHHIKHCPILHPASESPISKTEKAIPDFADCSQWPELRASPWNWDGKVVHY